MRREQDGQFALGLDLLQHLPDGDARHGIQPGRRFVEAEHSRLVDQAAGDFDASPHAARQMPDLFVAPLGQLHRREQVGDEALALLPRHAVQFGKDDQVFLDAQLEIARHRLRNDADRFPYAVRLLDDIEAVDQRAARGRHEQRRQHPDQRGLAGAIRAEQAEDFSFGDGKRDPLHGREVAEAFDDVPDFDGVHVRRSRVSQRPSRPLRSTASLARTRSCSSARMNRSRKRASSPRARR